MKLHRFKFRLLVFSLVFLFTEGVAHAEDARSLLERVDKLYRSNSSHAEIEMEVITENWERTIRMELWTSGMEKTLITRIGERW